MTVKRDPTDDEIRQLCEVVEEMGYEKEAYVLAGITERLYFKWKGEGRDDIAAGRMDTQCGKLVQSVKNAKAQRNRKLITYIRKAAEDPKHWTASAWILERTDPKRYGLNIRVHVEQELTDAIERLRAALPPEEFERAIAAIAGGAGAAGAEPDQDGEGEGAAGKPDAGAGEALLPPPATPETK